MKQKTALIITILIIVIGSNLLAEISIPGLVRGGQTIEEKYPERGENTSDFAIT